MRNECSIVRDLLPLYAENMVSDDTASFVAEHLESCSACREEMSKLEKSKEIADKGKTVTTSYINQAASLKAVKKKLRRKQILTILLSFVASVFFVGGTVILLCFYGFPADSENIRLETEFQHSGTGRVFVLHIRLGDEKHLGSSVKSIYQTDENGKYVYDENGEKILAGYEVTIREIPYGNDPNKFSIGYGYEYSSPPDKDFDFTITVKFKDTTVTYSMVEEGLFDPQNDVQR